MIHFVLCCVVVWWAHRDTEAVLIQAVIVQNTRSFIRSSSSSSSSGGVEHGEAVRRLKERIVRATGDIGAAGPQAQVQAQAASQLRDRSSSVCI